MIKESMIQEYEALTEQEKVSFLSHSLVSLTQSIYESRSTKGLEVLLKNLELITPQVRAYYKELKTENINTEVTHYLSRITETFESEGGVSEALASSLESLLELVQNSLDDEIMKEDETKVGEKIALDNLKKLMDLQVLRYEKQEQLSESA